MWQTFEVTGLLGNAVVPVIPELIANAINELEL